MHVHTLADGSVRELSLQTCSVVAVFSVGEASIAIIVSEQHVLKAAPRGLLQEATILNS